MPGNTTYLKHVYRAHLFFPFVTRIRTPTAHAHTPHTILRAPHFAPHTYATRHAHTHHHTCWLDGFTHTHTPPPPPPACLPAHTPHTRCHCRDHGYLPRTLRAFCHLSAHIPSAWTVLHTCLHRHAPHAPTHYHAVAVTLPFVGLRLHGWLRWVLRLRAYHHVLRFYAYTRCLLPRHARRMPPTSPPSPLIVACHRHSASPPASPPHTSNGGGGDEQGDAWRQKPYSSVRNGANRRRCTRGIWRRATVAAPWCGWRRLADQQT